ncbi:hypothetical protein Pla175_07960 [Pirellulimonas nuda]|uniref:Uncharacterized protein n=1 Tax=Pirellulimonas nuda TaxID=2528009 RepID=A0A518D7H6_9BACT|nr:hypothetical protein [Pirellulimonas nuda]QDU87434.1 hypothetical protein Pla175_07960 [Pirellulimonas nuda]
MRKFYLLGASLTCLSLASLGCVEPQGALPEARTSNKPALADDDPLATETQDKQDSEAMTEEDTQEMKNQASGAESENANEAGAMNSGAMSDDAMDDATDDAADATPEN